MFPSQSSTRSRVSQARERFRGDLMGGVREDGRSLKPAAVQYGSIQERETGLGDRLLGHDSFRGHLHFADAGAQLHHTGSAYNFQDGVGLEQEPRT